LNWLDLIEGFPVR